MARTPSVSSSAPDPTTINLTRLITRLQTTLLKPDRATEQRLRTSPYERSKVGANIDYARKLLLRLEQESLGMKVQSKKVEVQSHLLAQRDAIIKLAERLDELESYEQNDDSDDSEGEDLLGEDTPSDHTTSSDQFTPTSLAASTSASAFEAEQEHERERSPSPKPSDRDLLFPSSLRARHASGSSPETDTAQTTSTDNPTTSQTETLLTHHRTEQEALTNDLYSLAQQLKAQSLAFSATLETEDADILKRATEGLDKNEAGLEAASKRMGYLRKMSEGQGWWGRMMLYAWIAGLMVVAVLIVGVGPKLRFSNALW